MSLGRFQSDTVSRNSEAGDLAHHGAFGHLADLAVGLLGAHEHVQAPAEDEEGGAPHLDRKARRHFWTLYRVCKTLLDTIWSV